MKKLLLVLLLSILGFAANKTEPIIKNYKIEVTQQFNFYCIDGYEFIEDNRGNIHQIFKTSSYKLVGVEPIPIQLPKECKDTKWYQVLKLKLMVCLYHTD